MMGFLAAALLISEATQPRLPIDRTAGWTSLGPTDGLVQVVATDPHDPETVYAGTEGGLFRSDDQGGSWRKLPIPLEDVYFVTVAPSDSSVLYAATISPVPFNEPVNDLFRSTDGGDTWTWIDEVGWPFAYDVANDPSDALTIFVNSSALGTISRSTNGGSTWRSLPLQDVGVIAIDTVVPTTVYAYSHPPDAAGMYKSTDNGETWNPTGPSAAEVSCLAVDPVEHETVFAGYYAGSEHFRSLDGGATWTQPASFPPSSIWSLAIGAGSVPILYAGTESEGVFESGDRGATWSRLGELTGLIRSLAVAPDSGDRVLYAATEHGVSRIRLRAARLLPPRSEPLR